MLGLFIVYIFYSIKEGINLKWIAVAFMLFGIIIYWGGDLLGNYFENLSYRNEQFEKGYFAGTGRLVTILSALKYKFDFRCLFFGIGSGEYSVVESTSFSLAHNGFLSIFLPFGILGLMLYYYVFYTRV